MASTQEKEQLKNRKMILSIISNKGGVGKTSIAVSLAFYLADELGKTLLLELDSSPGDLEALFDLREDKSLDVAIKFPGSYKSNIKNIFHNLDVMKGFGSPIVAENIKPGDTKKLIKRIKEDYQFIVVDTQTVVNGIILDFLKISDLVFIVSDYSLESLFRISRMLQILINKFSLKTKVFHLLVNKKRLVDNFKMWDISKIIDFPVTGFINYERNFNKSNVLLNRRKIYKSKLFIKTKKIFQEVACN